MYVVTLRNYESYDACCASRMSERKGRRWLLQVRGPTLEVKQVGVRRGQFTALVILTTYRRGIKPEQKIQSTTKVLLNRKTGMGR
jgi:hypothetical protein